jgi:hypothetical protein
MGNKICKFVFLILGLYALGYQWIVLVFGFLNQANTSNIILKYWNHVCLIFQIQTIVIIFWSIIIKIYPPNSHKKTKIRRVIFVIIGLFTFLFQLYCFLSFTTNKIKTFGMIDCLFSEIIPSFTTLIICLYFVFFYLRTKHILNTT